MEFLYDKVGEGQSCAVSACPFNNYVFRLPVMEMTWNCMILLMLHAVIHNNIPLIPNSELSNPCLGGIVIKTITISTN